MNLYACDYDPSRLKDLKPGCARVVTPGSVGTGFAITGSRILTCEHVVRDSRQGAMVECHFGDARKRVACGVAHRDPRVDVAVLEPLQSAELQGVPARALLPLTPLFNYWWTWGFPAIAGGLGVPLYGAVADPDAIDRDGRKVMQLFAETLVGDETQLGGFSGSPVLTSSNLVAMIYRVLAGPTDSQRTRFGLLYAIPITSAHAALGGAGGEPGTGGAPVPPPDPRPSAEEAKQLRLFGQLKAASNPSELLGLVRDWRGKAPLPTGVPLIAAEKMLGMGAPRMALAALEQAGASTRQVQLRALAHSLLQEHDTAHALLASIENSSESGGILGGVFKRRYLETGNKVWLRCAFDQYENTYKARPDDPYPGINCAATALWLGDGKLSRKRASEVLDKLQAMPEDKRDHWYWATLGEAHLLRGKPNKALSCYEQAVAKQPGLARDIAVMRKQARISLPLLGQRKDKLDDVLTVGGVACFTGHRTDEPERARPRFPRERVEHVARRVKAELDKRGVRFGFSSAAGGADIVFLEQLLARGGEPTVFLPFPKEEFVATSVGDEWRARFDAVLNALPAGNLRVLMDRKPATPAEEDEAYSRCNEAIRQAALEAGRIYDAKPALIAVLNEAEAKKAKPLKGGTAETVRAWSEQLLGPSVLIDPLR